MSNERAGCPRSRIALDNGRVTPEHIFRKNLPLGMSVKTDVDIECGIVGEGAGAPADEVITSVAELSCVSRAW